MKPRQISIAFALGLAASLTYAGEPCEDNFSVSGNLLTGKLYRTTASIANAQPRDAFDGAMAFTTGNGFTVQSSDKNAGTISAVQTSNKRVPLAILLSPDGVNTKLAFTYQTPTGVHSPEDAIKKHFCSTVVAATNTARAGAAATNVPAASAPTSIIANSEASTVSPTASKVADKKDMSAKIPDSEFVKNGMPCFSGLCIGDGVAEMQKIKWKPLVKRPSRDISRDIEMLSKNFKGDVAGLLGSGYSYFMGGGIDNDALVKLGKIQATCSGSSFSGEFTTSSGAPVRVNAEFMPSADNSKHVLAVTAIYRKFTADTSKSQMNDMFAESNRRYAVFGANDNNKFFGKAGHAMYTFITDTLALQLAKDLNFHDKLKMHPLCGGATKISLD